MHRWRAAGRGADAFAAGAPTAGATAEHLGGQLALSGAFRRQRLLGARALDWGAPMKELKLDTCFEQLRRQMEEGQEHSRGTRAYIGVLRLLEQHSLEALTRAVRRALELGAPDKES